MKDPSFIQQMILKGSEVKEKVKTEFYSLNPEQLIWKPTNTVWSIAQCLEHLIIAEGLRIRVIEKKINRNFNSGIWEKINPLRSFWGTMLVTQTQERVKKKIKAPRLFHPKLDIPSHDILNRFDEHLDNLFKIINKCKEADLDQVYVTSPVSGLVTYSLRNAITIIIGHERRHISQAIRLKKANGFPS